MNSPFAVPAPHLSIKTGAPILVAPIKDELDTLATQAQTLLEQTRLAQQELLKTQKYALDFIKGRHLLLAGATGPGIGGALAVAALNLLAEGGSLTILGRDLTRSVNYETGRLMEKQAQAAGFGRRFHWINAGMALEGKSFETVVAALKEAGADQVIYVNGVAAASSGLLPGRPPVYVKDVDETGLFQWQLVPLEEKTVQVTRHVMGTMAVQFPQALEAAGIGVELAVFADWRGSLDKLSQNPDCPEYGRQGAYSTSLYLPKEIIQQHVAQNYGHGPKMMDIFYPIMRTRALPFIPGGMTMAAIFDKLMEKEGVRRIEQPELALETLHLMGQALTAGYDNPFPRLDKHEMPLDEWFYQVIARLNNDENSDFYYRRWIAP